MNHHDEHLLYLNNRAAWARYVAPRWREMLENAEPDRKRELWRIACPELRDELRRMAEERHESAA